MKQRLIALSWMESSMGVPASKTEAREHPAWQRYVLAVVMIAMGAGIRAWLLPGLSGRVPYITFYPAVMLAALYGGWSGGVVASLVSALVVVFWREPLGAPFIQDSADWLGLGVFLAGCMLVSAGGEALHRMRMRAVKAEAEAQAQATLTEVRSQAGESNRKLKLILDGMPEGFVALDQEWRYTHLNPMAARLLRKEPNELLGKIIWEVFPQAMQSAAYAQLRRAMEEQVAVAFEEYDAPSGRWYDNRCLPTPEGLIIFFSDTTQRHQEKEALRWREELLTQTIRVAGLGFFEHDHHTDTIHLSDKAREIYGFSASKRVTLTTLLESIYPEDREKTAAAIRHAHDPASDGRYAIERRMLRRDGSVRWVSVRSQTFFEGEGSARHPVRTVGAVLDMTERKQAEEAQGEARRLLRDVLDTVPVRVFWKDRESRYLGCNLPFAEDSGLGSTDELIGKNDFEMSWRDQADAYRADDRWVIENGLPKLGYEEPRPTLDGKRNWLRTSKIPLKDAAGNIIGVLGTYEDITASKRAEEVLRQSEEQFRAFFHTAAVGTAQIEMNGHFASVNDRLCQLTSYTREELLRMTPLDLAPPEDRARVQATLEAFLNGSLPIYQVEKRFLHKDGTIVWVQVAAALIRDSEGKPVRAAAVFQDITQRKQAEAALQESEARFRAIVETEPECVKILTSGGRLLEMNPAGLAMIEADRPEQVIGQSLEGLLPPEHRKAFQALIESVCRGNLGTLEFEIVGLKGGHHWLETHAVPFRRRPEDEVCLLAITRDITERKRAEEALRSAKEDLARANEALERRVQERTTSLKQTIQSLEGVLYHVAHDLRAPLRAMHCFAKLILENYGPQLNALGHDYAQRIIGASSRMDELTRDLLTYGRLGHQTVAWTSIDLNLLFDHLLDQLRSEIAKQKAEIQIDKPLPKVLADPKIMEQVLTNLIGNALKFVAPDTAPRIHIWGEVIQGRLLLSIQDNGIGIAPEHHERIFGIFERLHEPEDYPGTGIGLAIVKKGMDLLEGEVQLISQVGKGSRFILKFKCISLPL